MLSTTEKYNGKIFNYCDQLRVAEITDKELNEKLDRYKAELDSATKELKKKHNYEKLMLDISENNNKIDAATEKLLMNRIFLVVSILGELFRANESSFGQVVGEIKSLWNIELSHNSNVSDSTFVACFNAYIKEVCTEENWREREYDMQSNGFIWVDQKCPYHWSPCIGVGIQDKLLNDLDPFMKWAEDKIGKLSAEWAKRWVEANKVDDIKQRKLLEALRDTIDKQDNKK